MARPHRSRRPILALALLLAAAPAAHAGSLGLYVHHGEDAGYWMSPLAEEANATSGSAGYNPLVMASFAVDQLPEVGDPDSEDEPAAATWVFPLAPALESTLPLDTGRTVDFDIHISARVTTVQGNPVPGAGRVTVLALLRQGTTTVAQASTNVTFEGEAGFLHVPLNATPLVDTLDPSAGNLEWLLRATGPSTSYVLGLGNGTGHTRVTVPLPQAPVQEAEPAPTAPSPTVTPAPTQAPAPVRPPTAATTSQAEEPPVSTSAAPPADGQDAPGVAVGALALLAVVAAAVRRRL